MVKYWVLLVLCLFLMPGCRELVQDEFERFDRVPVVNSVIVAGNEISLHVSYTGSLGDTAISVVPNANISLLRNGVFVENMEYVGEGYYSSQTIAEAGNCYSCEIEIPGFDVITCEDSIPVPIVMTGIEYNETAGLDEEGRPFASVTFTFANDQTVEQYFQIIINEIEYGYTNATYLIDITDPLITGGGIPIAVFSDKNITGNSYEMTLNFKFSSFGTNYHDRKVVMELRSLSYNYYQYLRKEYLYELSRYPDDLLSVVPGFNLYSNIQGGFGIFAGYSVFVTDTIDQ